MVDPTGETKEPQRVAFDRRTCPLIDRGSAEEQDFGWQPRPFGECRLARRCQGRSDHAGVPSWLMVIVAVVLAVSGVAAVSAQDKYTLKSPSGIAFSDFRGSRTGRCLQRPDRRSAQGDRRQSGDDRRLPGRHSRRRQAFPRRLQDREAPVKPKKSTEAPFDVNVPDTFTQARHREGQQEVPGERRMGLCAVQL